MAMAVDLAVCTINDTEVLNYISTTFFLREEQVRDF